MVFEFHEDSWFFGFWDFVNFPFSLFPFSLSKKREIDGFSFLGKISKSS